MTKCDERIAALEEQLKSLDSSAASLLSRPASRGGSSRTPDVIGKKKLQADELQAVIQRLTRPIEPPATPLDMQLPSSKKETKILSSDDVESLVQRLGVADLDARRSKQEQLWQKEVESLPLTVITAAKGEYAVTKISSLDEQDDIGKRLTTEFINHRQARIDQLRVALYGTSATKQLSASDLKASAERLCTETLTKKEEEASRLREKYMPDTKSKKLSRDEQQQSADRLCKKH